MFEALEQQLEGNEAALTELQKVKENYTNLSGEVGTLEAKLNDSISKRDKFKGFSQIVKSKLGFEEGEELSEDTITAKINSLLEGTKKEGDNKSNIYKAEIAKLEEELGRQKGSFEQEINVYKNDMLNTQIDLQLFKNSAQINAVNAKAHEMIMSELKKGVSFEDGKLIFKNEDGTTARKNGVPLTLKDRIEDLRSNEDLAFLFKSDAKSGSGTQTVSTSGATNGGKELSAATKEYLARAAQLGINVQL